MSFLLLFGSCGGAPGVQKSGASLLLPGFGGGFECLGNRHVLRLFWH